MRMWMVNTKYLCSEHLLGEHCECHMFLGTILKKKKLDGYISKNLFERDSLKSRHDELAEELYNRKINGEIGKINKYSVINLNHKSPLEYDNSIMNYLVDSKVNKELALVELISRCDDCRRRFLDKCTPDEIEIIKKYNYTLVVY